MARTAYDDREDILAHFATNLPKLKTLEAVAAKGMTIFGYEPKPDGSGHVLAVKRHIKSATLIRRYREYRKTQDRLEDPFGELPACTISSRYIGISAPEPTLAFGPNPKVKRGRPKKHAGSHFSLFMPIFRSPMSRPLFHKWRIFNDCNTNRYSISRP